MDLFVMQDSRPAWASFENPTGQKNKGGRENFGAKGHAFEYFSKGEEKVLCDIDGPGIIRRIWFTLDDRSEQMLKQIYLRIYWDNKDVPSVDVPIADFFCMGHGRMLAFENELFASPEGRSFNCYISMPFQHHAKILLVNLSDKDNRRLFYDVDLTLEKLPANSLYFHASYTETSQQPLGTDIPVLPKVLGKGRFLGMNVSVKASFDYEDSWWGEGEIKVYLDHDEYPSLVGSGIEDYIGTAWGQGEYINRYQGCTLCKNNKVSFYRFHIKDPIFFGEDCKVELLDIGGNSKPIVMRYLAEGKKLIPVTADVDGKLIQFYQKDYDFDLLPDSCFINFYRQDEFAIVAYYYLSI